MKIDYLSHVFFNYLSLQVLFERTLFLNLGFLHVFYVQIHLIITISDCCSNHTGLSDDYYSFSRQYRATITVWKK